MSLNVIGVSPGVQFRPNEGLQVRYVPLSLAAPWDDNPKAHDLPGIIHSIQKYGFQDPPRFMWVLNAGAGGLVEGNGRVRALAIMQTQGLARPRGIGVISGPERAGEWAVPVVFGADVLDALEAAAYALDHNNLTATGGDFTAFFVAQLYDETAYHAVLASLQTADALPVTVTEADIVAVTDAILTSAGHKGRPKPAGARIRLGEFSLVVDSADFDEWFAALEVSHAGDKDAMVASVRGRLGLDDHKGN